VGGAGGAHQLPGDYVYMNHRSSYIDAGQWGIMRVRPKGDTTIHALNEPAIAPSDSVRPVKTSAVTP
jgi:hypothetical protein